MENLQLKCHDLNWRLQLYKVTQGDIQSLFQWQKNFPDSQATWRWIPTLIIFEDIFKKSPKIIIGKFLQGVRLYPLFTVRNCQLRGSDNILSLIRGHRDQCLWDEKVSVTWYI